MKAIKGPCAVRQHDSVLVCVSGGIDSMVLLNLILEIRPCLGLKLGVFHADHGLRTGESSRDARFVEEACRGLRLPYHVVKLNMAPGTPNVEEAARTKRYDAVRECMLRHGFSCAATGHTLHDQAETVVFRMVRGTGIRGLAGMDYRNGEGIIRPMMDIPKGLVRDYALAKGIAYVHDRSNDDARLARNLIRSAIIPVMEKINPRAASSISSLARIAREEGAALERMSRTLEESTADFDWGIIRSFRADDLKDAERALVKRMFIRVILGFIHEPRGIDAIQVDQALAVLWGETRSHTMKRKVRVVLDGGLLVFHLTGQGPHYQMEVGGQGDFFIPEIQKTVHVGPSLEGEGPWVLRSFLKGDRVGGKRVADMLGRMKVPGSLRPFWPVLASRHGVVALTSGTDVSLPCLHLMDEGHGR